MSAPAPARRPLHARDLVDVRDVRLALLRAAAGAAQGALVGAWWGGPYAAAGSVTGLLLVVPTFVEGTARRRGLPTHGAVFEWALISGLLTMFWGLLVGAQAGYALAVATHGLAGWSNGSEALALGAMTLTGAAPSAAAMTFLHLDDGRPPHRHSFPATVERAMALLFALPLIFIYFAAGRLDRALRPDDP